MQRPDVIVWLRAIEDLEHSLECFAPLNLPQLTLPSLCYETVPALQFSNQHSLLFASPKGVEAFHEQNLYPDENLVHYTIGLRTLKAFSQVFSQCTQVQVYSSFNHFLSQPKTGCKITYPCSESFVADEIHRAMAVGVQLLPLVVYRPVQLDISQELAQVFLRYHFPAFMVMAPSQSIALQAFIERDFMVFCLGQRTFETLLRVGFSRVVVANEANLESMKEALCEVLQSGV